MMHRDDPQHAPGDRIQGRRRTVAHQAAAASLQRRGETRAGTRDELHATQRALSHAFCTVQPLQRRRGHAIHALGGIYHYARVECSSASGLNATCNSVVSVELSDSIFTICVDFVDSDKRFPKDSQDQTLREPCIMITPAPAQDPSIGLDYLLLRQEAVIHYYSLPNSQLLHQEICTAQSLLNGDLLIARICRHFRDQQQILSQHHHQHHHR